MKRSLFDVGFLLALLDESHESHDIARRWLDANIEGGWASCPLTQNGFVRVISQPRYAASVPTTAAIERLFGATATEYHEFWGDTISVTDPSIIHPEKVLGPKQITDVYLLALAVANGGRLVTFDQRISLAAVSGATEDHLYCL